MPVGLQAVSGKTNFESRDAMNPPNEADEKARKFWACQRADYADGYYHMSEDQHHIEMMASVEMPFEVIEFSAYEAVRKEAEEYRTALKKADDMLNEAYEESHDDKYLKASMAIDMIFAKYPKGGKV